MYLLIHLNIYGDILCNLGYYATIKSFVLETLQHNHT